MNFLAEIRRISNLLQVDNTTNAVKCKYLFSVFIRALNTCVYQWKINRKSILKN